MSRPCPYTTTVASYLLDLLREREHEEFRRHAMLCARCRREIDELEPVVRLLAALKADYVAANGWNGG